MEYYKMLIQKRLEKARKVRRVDKFLITAALLLLSVPAMGDTWLNIGGVSKHFGQGVPGYKFNEVNAGLGIETEVNDITLSAGIYNNSIGKESRYIAAEKLLVKRGNFGVGLSAGFVDNYWYRNGSFIPMILPVARWDGDVVGIRMIFIPPVDKLVTPAIAIQVRIKLQ